MKNIAFDQDHYYPAVEPQDSASGIVVKSGDGVSKFK